MTPSADFQRSHHQYTHGSDLRNKAREVIKLIIRANNINEKEEALEELRVTIEEIKVIIRICKQVKAFNSFNSFETAINHVTDISRQAEGWLKGAREKRRMYKGVIPRKRSGTLSLTRIPASARTGLMLGNPVLSPRK